MFQPIVECPSTRMRLQTPAHQSNSFNTDVPNLVLKLLNPLSQFTFLARDYSSRNNRPAQTTRLTQLRLTGDKNAGNLLHLAEHRKMHDDCDRKGINGYDHNLGQIALHGLGCWVAMSMYPVGLREGMVEGWRTFVDAFLGLLLLDSLLEYVEDLLCEVRVRRGRD